MSRPPSTPTEAADLHLRLIGEQRTRWYKEYCQGFWETYYGDNEGVTDGGMQSMDEYGRYKRLRMSEFVKGVNNLEKYRVSNSETVFVTADICHVIKVMSKGMPEDMLLPEDVPFEQALFLLADEYDFREWESSDRSRKIRAIQISSGDPIRSWGGAAKPGIVITLYCAVDDIMPEHGEDGNLVVIEMTGWQFNCMWTENDPVPDEAHAPHIIGPEIAAIRKFLLTLFRFMQEEIVHVSRERLSRAARRRAERTDYRIPEDGAVSVVHLRRVRYVGPRGNEESREVAWTHRFWVAGHKRHLDYLEPGRETWVRPYLKGDEALPIVLKHRVVDVHR